MICLILSPNVSGMLECYCFCCQEMHFVINFRKKEREKKLQYPNFIWSNVTLTWRTETVTFKLKLKTIWFSLFLGSTVVSKFLTTSHSVLLRFENAMHRRRKPTLRLWSWWNVSRFCRVPPDLSQTTKCRKIDKIGRKEATDRQKMKLLWYTMGEFRNLSCNFDLKIQTLKSSFIS